MLMLSSPDSNFENNWRRKQEIGMRPVADRIYKVFFGEEVEICRSDHGDNLILDIKHAIDVNIILPNKMILTAQEKFLSSSAARFHSITVEYYQNPKTGEMGDWSKLACQLYFVGYVTPDLKKFSPWVLANWPNVVIHTLLGDIDWVDNRNKRDGARATFRYTDMYKLPEDCIVAKSWTSS